MEAKKKCVRIYRSCPKVCQSLGKSEPALKTFILASRNCFKITIKLFIFQSEILKKKKAFYLFRRVHKMMIHCIYIFFLSVFLKKSDR